MNLTLLNGRYRANDARILLTNLISTKIAFHEAKLKIAQHTEDDIRQSEKRIAELNADLQKTLARFPETDDWVFLHANTSVQMIVAE